MFDSTTEDDADTFEYDSARCLKNDRDARSVIADWENDRKDDLEGCFASSRCSTLR